MNKFQNKYRIQSTRLQNWDYRWAGAYFITICTQNREHYFGKIVNKKMELSHIGVIADIFWHQIPQHTKNVELGAFVVMPNHIHGVLILTNDNVNTEYGDDGIVEYGNGDDDIHFGNGIQYGDGIVEYGDGIVEYGGDIVEYGGGIVEALHATPLPQPQPPSSLSQPSPSPHILSPKNEQMSMISPKSNSISTIIRSYKSAVSKHTHRLGFEFQWQSRFHDHIIRNDKSFQNISNYIVNNPEKWPADKFSQP